MLSQESLQAIDHELAKYPAEQRASAIMAALRIAQDEHLWLNDELIVYVAELVGVPHVRAYEVATFYSMYETKPVARNKICVCTNIACMLRGSDDVVARLKEKLGVGLGETTADGKVTLKEVECLGACVGAPMMSVNRDYHEHLTDEKIDQILQQLS